MQSLPDFTKASTEFSKDDLWDFMQALQMTAFQNKEGMSVWRSDDSRNPFGCELSETLCSSGAMMVAANFNGKVYGYHIPDENKYKDIIGFDCMAHDFAIVGNYLIDYWAEYVNCCGKDLLDFTNEEDLKEIQKRYLPFSFWEEVPLYEVKRTYAEKWMGKK